MGRTDEAVTVYTQPLAETEEHADLRRRLQARLINIKLVIDKLLDGNFRGARAVGHRDICPRVVDPRRRGCLPGRHRELLISGSKVSVITDR